MAGFWEDRSVYLTGATGFIGSLVAKVLLEAGTELTVLTRDHARAADLADQGARVNEGDVTRPGTLQLPEAVDTVIHGAAWVAYGVPRQKRELFLETNVQGTKHVLQAAKDAGARRFCHVSSVAAIGPTPAGLYTEERVREGRYPEYRSLYERSKHEAHMHVLENAGSLQVTLPMPGVVLGPDGEFGMLQRWFLEGKLWGVRGDNPSPFVHVVDATEGLLRAVEHGEGAYILVDQNLVLHQLLQAFSEASGAPVPDRSISVSALKALARVAQVPYHLAGKVPPLSRELVDQLELPYTYSSQKAVKELGWQPDLLGRLEDDFRRLQAG